MSQNKDRMNKENNKKNKEKKEQDKKKYAQLLENPLNFDLSSVFNSFAALFSETPVGTGFNDLSQNIGENLNNTLDKAQSLFSNFHSTAENMGTKVFTEYGNKFIRPDVMSNTINDFANNLQNIFNNFIPKMDQGSQNKFSTFIETVKNNGNMIFSLAKIFIGDLKNNPQYSKQKKAKQDFIQQYKKGHNIQNKNRGPQSNRQGPTNNFNSTSQVQKPKNK